MVDQGGIKQMPYRGGTPTLIEFGQGLKALKKFGIEEKRLQRVDVTVVTNMTREENT